MSTSYKQSVKMSFSGKRRKRPSELSLFVESGLSLLRANIVKTKQRKDVFILASF